MKHKIIMSAALIISMTGMTGCFFFPAEEELLEPPTVAIEDIAYSTYTAKQKTIEDKTVATGYVFCKSQYNASFPESGGTLKTIYVTAGQHVEEGDLLAEPRQSCGGRPGLTASRRILSGAAALSPRRSHRRCIPRGYPR